MIVRGGSHVYNQNCKFLTFMHPNHHLELNGINQTAICFASTMQNLNIKKNTYTFRYETTWYYVNTYLELLAHLANAPSAEGRSV